MKRNASSTWSSQFRKSESMALALAEFGKREGEARLLAGLAGGARVLAGVGHRALARRVGLRGQGAGMLNRPRDPLVRVARGVVVLVCHRKLPRQAMA